MNKPFYSWLLQFTEDDTDIGDLSRDVKRDSEFPRRSVSYKHLKDYLESKNACYDAIQAFEKAFTQYKVTKTI